MPGRPVAGWCARCEGVGDCRVHIPFVAAYGGLAYWGTVLSSPPNRVLTMKSTATIHQTHPGIVKRLRRAERAYSAAFVIHFESIPEIGSVVESSAVDIEGGEGKSVGMASLVFMGQHIYSTSFLS